MCVFVPFLLLVKESLKGLMVSLGCLKEVSKVFQGRLKGILRGLDVCFMGALRVFLGC